MTNTQDLVKLSAADMAKAVKAKEVSSRELVEAHLAVIEAAEPEIKAFLHVSADVALEQADAFDKRMLMAKLKAYLSLQAFQLPLKT